MTAELLFGFDHNRNFEVESFERPHMSQDEGASVGSDPEASDVLNGTDIPPLSNTDLGINDFDAERIPEPWSRYLTVTAAERNVDYYGRARIYLNHPDLAMLQRRLESTFSEETANFVIALRQSGPYAGSEYPSQRPISRQPLSKKAAYDITNLATLLNVSVATGTEENRKVHASPWLNAQRSDDSASFSSFCDAVTIHESSVIVGRVSLASAPAGSFASNP